MSVDLPGTTTRPSRGREHPTAEAMSPAAAVALLFAVANVARLLQINPEFALARTNKKFTSRFRFIESELKKQGLDIHNTTLAELDALWNRAKDE